MSDHGCGMQSLSLRCTGSLIVARRSVVAITGLVLGGMWDLSLLARRWICSHLQVDSHTEPWGGVRIVIFLNKKLLHWVFWQFSYCAARRWFFFEKKYNWCSVNYTYKISMYIDTHVTIIVKTVNIPVILKVSSFCLSACLLAYPDPSSLRQLLVCFVSL